MSRSDDAIRHASGKSTAIFVKRSTRTYTCLECDGVIENKDGHMCWVDSADSGEFICRSHHECWSAALDPLISLPRYLSITSKLKDLRTCIGNSAYVNSLKRLMDDHPIVAERLNLYALVARHAMEKSP
jgi:hypothetical protein